MYVTTSDDLKRHAGGQELLSHRQQHAEAHFWILCSRGLATVDQCYSLWEGRVAPQSSVLGKMVTR